MCSWQWPSSNALRTLAVAGSVLILAVGCQKSSSGSDSGSPTAPGGSSGLSGTWTGTLSRPGGLAPIAVRWEATRTDGPMTGPITLTNGSSSVTFPLVASVAGPKTSVTSIHFSFSVNAGSIATLPNCSIKSNESIEATNLKEPITTITTAPFRLSYNQCQGFLDPVPPGNFRTESTQLVITKQ